MATVIIMPRARRQFLAALSWWYQNRDKAPTAFDDDVAETWELLAENPTIGNTVRSRRRGVRRVLLERVRYYVYYRVNNGDVEVISIWHSSRRPPRL